jgi:thioredoxin reductase
VQKANGDTVELEADTLVCAAGSSGDSRLHESVEGKVAEIYMVGDCAEPGAIVDAVRDGYDVGRRV